MPNRDFQIDPVVRTFRNRERSVNSLELICSIVFGLAITNGANNLSQHIFAVGGERVDQYYTQVLAFIALVFTAIPFFHGGSRYLTDRYISNERNDSKRLMIDFMIWFVEGLLFVGIAALLGSISYFYIGYFVILLIDVVWISSIGPLRSEKSLYVRWCRINGFALIAVAFVSWTDHFGVFAQSVVLVLIAVVRTVLDYQVVWPEYYPSSGGQSSLSVAPFPALPPERD